MKDKHYQVWVQACQAPGSGKFRSIVNARDLKMLEIQTCQQMQQCRFVEEPG